MISIGERINGMFKDVRESIKNKDPKAIQELAKKADGSRCHVSGCECGACCN